MSLIKYHHLRSSLIFILLTSLGLNPAKAQINKSLYLYNAHKKKEVYFPTHTYIELWVNTKNIDTSLYKERDIIYSGILVSCTDSFITLNVKIVNKQSEYQNNANGHEHIYYNSDTIPNIEVIQIKDITHIRYQKNNAVTIESIGTFMAITSTVTTLLAAPLVAINYSAGTINAQRYFLWAGAGLAGLAVSIPIIYLSSNNDYSITTEDNDSYKDKWRLLVR